MYAENEEGVYPYRTVSALFIVPLYKGGYRQKTQQFQTLLFYVTNHPQNYCISMLLLATVNYNSKNAYHINEGMCVW
jgi:hypothetical protein